jgi:hypothetical protein
MPYINWEKPFQVDLAFAGLSGISVSLPTYGNFGGPGYSEGVFVGPSNPAPVDPTPVDWLDRQFQIHDAAFSAAATPSERSAADLNLIQGIQSAAPGGTDAEASLYGGAATLVVVEQLATRGDLNLLEPRVLADIAARAFQEIGEGFAGLDTDDIAGAGSWLNSQVADWLLS